MADKYRNAWIIRQIMTAWQRLGHIVFCRKCCVTRKKAMLNTIYGCTAQNPCKTIMELTGDYFIYCDTDSKICQTLTAGGGQNGL